MLTHIFNLMSDVYLKPFLPQLDGDETEVAIKTGNLVAL